MGLGTRATLNKEQMTGFVAAVGVVVVGLPALVALGNNIGTDAFAQPLIKNKIFADKLIGQVLGLGLPRVFNNSAFQLIYLLKPFVAEIGRGLFAADAPGALEQNRFLFLSFQYFFHHRQAVSKRIDIGANGSFKVPNFRFIMVSHINHHRIGVLQQGVEFLGI